jgi:hypothetical protein
MKKKNFSILIQGPYIKSTSKLIYILNKIFPTKEIILSCYDEKISEKVKKKVILVRNKDVGSIVVYPKNFYLNLKRQANTTYSGCKTSDKEWIIKFRSDMEIFDRYKFKKVVDKFLKNIEKGHEIKLLTLNTGSLDIFAHYQMPFHYNDHFFICKRLTLLQNCNYLRSYDEQKLVDDFNPKIYKNYYHKKKFSLKFHAEQLIHFCKPILIDKKIKYCCDMSKKIILRNIIWNAKHIMIFSSSESGIRNLKHYNLFNSPTLRSELVGISFKSLELYKLIYKSPKRLRFIFILLLKFHGFIRKILFLFLTYKSVIINKIKKSLCVLKSYLKSK